MGYTLAELNEANGQNGTRKYRRRKRSKDNQIKERNPRELITEKKRNDLYTEWTSAEIREKNHTKWVEVAVVLIIMVMIYIIISKL